jgi:hypothetical protein
VKTSKGRIRATAAEWCATACTGAADHKLKIWAAYACAIFFAAIAAQAADTPAAPERCLRAVSNADVFIDLKRDELSIAVTNLRGNCDVIVNDTGMFGAKNDIVNFTQFALADATVVQTFKRSSFRTWTASRRLERDMQSGRKRLVPGQALVMRTNMVSVTREIDLDRRKRGEPGLPWGQRVLLTIDANIFFTAGDDDPLGIPEVHVRQRRVTSSPFVYRLPKGPNAAMRQRTDETTLEDIEGED